MKIYLDTNILRDCLKNRSTSSNRLLEVIRQKKIDCGTSVFTLMELVDIEKDHSFFTKKLLKGEEVSKINRQKSERDLHSLDLTEISNQIDTIQETYDFLELIAITESQGWQLAADICKLSNLNAPDSLHVASAIGSGCDIMITNDQFLKTDATHLIKASNQNIDEQKNKIKLEILNTKEALKRLE